MTLSNDAATFAQVVHAIDPQSRLLRAWELKGGVSAQVTALEIARPDGQTHKMIVRQHGLADLKNNPNIATDEFRLLQMVRSVSLAAPEPYYLDQSCTILATPYIVVEFVEGETVFDLSRIPELIPQMAAYLAQVHSAGNANLNLSFLPQQAHNLAKKLRERPAVTDDSLDEGRIRDTLESVWPWPQRNASVLLHGDFWPGNILWKEGQIAAVIDWEDAAIGDPLSDLAISRLDMLWAFGIEAMQQFTARYQSLTSLDYSNLPYWDLCTALRPAFKIGEWAGDAQTEKTMREMHGWFVAQAYERIAAFGL